MVFFQLFYTTYLFKHNFFNELQTFWRSIKHKFKFVSITFVKYLSKTNSSVLPITDGKWLLNKSVEMHCELWSTQLLTNKIFEIFKYSILMPQIRG